MASPTVLKLLLCSQFNASKLEEVYVIIGEQELRQATNSHKIAIKILESYFIPKKDTIFSTIKFCQMAELKSIPILEFIQRLEFLWLIVTFLRFPKV